MKCGEKENYFILKNVMTNAESFTNEAKQISRVKKFKSGFVLSKKNHKTRKKKSKNPTTKIYSAIPNRSNDGNVQVKSGGCSELGSRHLVH